MVLLTIRFAMGLFFGFTPRGAIHLSIFTMPSVHESRSVRLCNMYSMYSVIVWVVTSDIIIIYIIKYNSMAPREDNTWPKKKSNTIKLNYNEKKKP